MNYSKIILLAMQEKAPELFQQLTESGGLQKYVEDLNDQMGNVEIELTHQIANQHGEKEAKSYLEAVGILNMANALARERVLGEMLEFPQDEESPQSLDETTPLETAT